MTVTGENGNNPELCGQDYGVAILWSDYIIVIR